MYTGGHLNLIQRIARHKNEPSGFSARYTTNQLVWYELNETMTTAILREKQLKAGSRARKIQLIMAGNPEWRDLYPDILESTVSFWRRHRRWIAAPRFARLNDIASGVG